MLSKTLDEAESEDWICELGNEFCKQMELYREYPEEKVKRSYAILHKWYICGFSLSIIKSCH